MPRPHAITRMLLFIALLMAGAGCSRRPLPDSHNPHFIRGAKQKKDGNYSEAATAFKRCLRHSPDCASAHLQLGLLYEDKLDDPLNAVHHYRLYLEARPDSKDSPAVRQWLRRAEDELHRELDAERSAPESKDNGGPGKPAVSLDAAPAVPDAPPQPTVTVRERRLAHRIKELTSENALLREALIASKAEQRAAPPTAPRKDAETSARQSPRPVPAKTRSHIVAKGETLSKISRKCYGTDRYWTRIRDANTDVLRGKDGLVPGMILHIPELPEPSKTTGPPKG